MKDFNYVAKKLDWTEEEFWEVRLPQINTRTADIRYLLDELESRQRSGKMPWAKIDLNRVGVFGHWLCIFRLSYRCGDGCKLGAW